MLQSTINNSSDDHSNKNVVKSDPKSNQLVATLICDRKKRKINDNDTTKGNSPHKLLTNRKKNSDHSSRHPTGNQRTVDGVVTSGRGLHAVRAVFHK